MIDFGQKVSGDLLRSPAAVEGAVRRNAVAVLNAIGEGARSIVKAPLRRGVRLPGDSRPHLLDTIKLDRATAGNLMARVRTDSPIAVFREKNTAPHVIVPKNARVLRFIPRGGSVPVFTMYVSHPGTQGTHSWEKSGIWVQARFEPMLKLAVDAGLQGRLWTGLEVGLMSGLMSASAYSPNP